jgi:hypothetical protein
VAATSTLHLTATTLALADKNVICCEQCEREYHVGCVCKLHADLKRSALHVIEKAKGLCASSRREEGTGHRRRRRPPQTDMAGGGGLDWRIPAAEAGSARPAQELVAATTTSSGNGSLGAGVRGEGTSLSGWGSVVI